jgi:hypothetical protein
MSAAAITNRIFTRYLFNPPEINVPVPHKAILTNVGFVSQRYPE